MKAIRLTMLLLAVVVVLGVPARLASELARVAGGVAMLPPETFRDPIFAAAGDSGDDSDGDVTEFA